MYVHEYVCVRVYMRTCMVDVGAWHLTFSKNSEFLSNLLQLLQYVCGTYHIHTTGSSKITMFGR